MLTVALTEIGADARDPQLGAVPERGDWVLSGTKTTVPAAHLAGAVVVPARDPEGDVRLFVVPTDARRAHRRAPGHVQPRAPVPRRRSTASWSGPTPSWPAPDSSADGQAPIDWIVDRATVGLCAQAAGVSEAGMRITAGYVGERKQFDRAIGTFQAVGHRMADCYVDNEAIRLSMLLAAQPR